MTVFDLAYWRAHGKPYQLAVWAVELRAQLREAGYTVYDYPDDGHLEAVPPEDHTPFSATAWPVSPAWSVYGWGNALDVMPPDPARRLPTLEQLAAQLIADKRVGLAPWLKYLNHTLLNGRCEHVSWQPFEAVRESSDRGHLHLSGRSDWTMKSLGDGYRLLRNLAGGETEMFITSVAGHAEMYASNGVECRHIPSVEALASLQTLGAKTLVPFPTLAAMTAVAGPLAAVAPIPGTLTDDQLPKLAGFIAIDLIEQLSHKG